MHTTMLYVYSNNVQHGQRQTGLISGIKQVCENPERNRLRQSEAETGQTSSDCKIRRSLRGMGFRRIG